MSAAAENLLASEWRRWSDSLPQLIRPLAGGLTNRSFLIKTNEQLQVLRLNARNSDSLNLDRHAETEALQLAASADLSPPLIYRDPADRYQVTGYIDGTALDIRDQNALTHAAQLLRGIHTLPGISAGLDINKKIALYLAASDGTSQFHRQLHALQPQIAPHITTTTRLHKGPLNLCHNDLLATNILRREDGRLVAIDWEYAASGDPFFDLAVFVEGNGLAHNGRETLLQEYLQHPPAQCDRRRLFHWRVIYRYLEVLWYTVQFTSGKQSRAEDAVHIRACICRLEDLASTPVD
ncbi:choline/ethanolamine kinase family protein [Microbulbifer pacificus]|uniref:Choline/ethanolamine kinase family protein n=1 Tax=Microbulbifer pacificus TaxID=407164 RepID=A0AAU0N0G2_9GAMM|nr:choline/ethanolamine kinase family protein [Microbulbifer pacificus]WOX06504.1 choline/ethanolamine kinase family protein [Microbulbifer pacificus]